MKHFISFRSELRVHWNSNRDFYTDVYTIFNRIKFTIWPHQWSFAKQLKSNDQKVPKQAEAKRDGVINPPNYNVTQFKTRKILMLSKCYESTEVDRRTRLHVPSGIHLSTSSDTHHHVHWKQFFNRRCRICTNKYFENLMKSCYQLFEKMLSIFGIKVHINNVFENRIIYIKKSIYHYWYQQ